MVVLPDRVGVVVIDIYRANGELNETIAFYNMPKVPIFLVEVPDVLTGDVLTIQSEYIVSAAPFPNASCFLAGMVRLYNQWLPANSTGDNVSLAEGIALTPGNGFDLSVPDHNYYGRRVDHAVYKATQDMGTIYICAIAWAASAAAGRWDGLTIVPDYGAMSATRQR